MLGLRRWLPVVLLAFGVAGCPENKTGLAPRDLAAVDLTGIAAPDLTGVAQDLAPPPDADLAGVVEDLTGSDVDLTGVAAVDLRTDIQGPDLRPYTAEVVDVTQDVEGPLVITYFGIASQIATFDGVTFQITVLDKSGDPVIGVDAKLTLPPGWAIYTQALQTDATGEAFFELLAGPAPGVFPITISGPGIEPFTFDVTSVEASPDQVLPLVNWALVDPNATIAATLPRPAIDNPMLGPYGIAPDAAGGYFFPDLPQHRIFHVDASGVLTLVAGTGVNTDPDGVITNGMMATDAPIYGPHSLVFDGTNLRLYFLDQTTFVGDNQYNEPLGSSKVRMIDLTNGQISTVAGGSSADPLDPDALDVPLVAYHLAVDPATSTLAIADRGSEGTATNRIRIVNGATASVLLTQLSTTCASAATWKGCTGGDRHCPLAFNAAGDTLYMAGDFCTGAAASANGVASIAMSGGAITIVKSGTADATLLGETMINLYRSGTTLYLSGSTTPGIFTLPSTPVDGAFTKVIGDGSSGFIDYVSRTEAALSGYVIGAPRADGRLVFSIYDDPQAYAGVRIVW